MIVTLSRQVGSDGDRIAARVSAALDLELIDRNTVRTAAHAAGVPAALLQRLLYEGHVSVASEILESLGQPRTERNVGAPAVSPLLNVFAPMLPPAAMSLEEAAQAVGLVIKDIASRGKVLVLGQAGQMLLRGYEGACHVQIVAPPELRAARLAEREQVSIALARRMVRAGDEARATYLARYFNARWLDPLLYHLVINTGQTSVEAAVSLIVHAAQAVAVRPA